MARIDTQWFRERIRSSRYRSLRSLAKVMSGRNKDLNISSLSLMLRGKRLMLARTVADLANLLDIPVAEILRRAGYPVKK